jgi:hypothetical protein
MEGEIMRTRFLWLAVVGCALLAFPASSEVIYNNLTPNNLMAMATRPGAGTFEIESADDFFLNSAALIDSASFTGLIVPSVTGGSTSIASVVVEIYQLFPLDSDATRTPNVPTRANSPSDVALDGRDSAASELTFTSAILSGSFTALNSVQPGGIHPSPLQTTGGNGPLTGQEVQINVSLSSPFMLSAGHYFFVPQVDLTNGGNFYWLSASRPIAGAGTTPFAPDLQAWTRDQALDPDWLRVGTDIVGGTTPPMFNAAFSLGGVAVPEPAGWALVLTGLVLACIGRLKLPRH